MQSWDARVCRAGNRPLRAASGRLSSFYRVTIREFVQGWWTIFIARSTSAWIVRGYRSTSNFRWLSIRMHQATVDRLAPRRSCLSKRGNDRARKRYLFIYLFYIYHINISETQTVSWRSIITFFLARFESERLLDQDRQSDETNLLGVFVWTIPDTKCYEIYLE